MKNITLRTEMDRQNMTGLLLSKLTGINRSYISLIANGRLIPTEVQKRKIALALKKDEEDLFNETTIQHQRSS